MINNENELLEYIMTSDFGEDMSVDEIKSILLFCKNYVRKTYSINKSLNYEIENLKKELEYKNLFKIKLESDVKFLNKKYNDSLNRKLSWKERFLGHIKK